MSTGMPTAVVGDAYAAVRLQDDDDAVAVPGQRFVDGVVDDFVDELAQAAFAGGADVHARSLAYGVEAFEHRDRAGVVDRCVGGVGCGQGVRGACGRGAVGGRGVVRRGQLRRGERRVVRRGHR
jgi:hypothetical protein